VAPVIVFDDEGAEFECVSALVSDENCSVTG
jgi:hypothetical protein